MTQEKTGTKGARKAEEKLWELLPYPCEALTPVASSRSRRKGARVPALSSPVRARRAPGRETEKKVRGSSAGRLARALPPPPSAARYLPKLNASAQAPGLKCPL